MSTFLSTVGEMSVKIIGLDDKVCMTWTKADTAILISDNCLVERAKGNCNLDEAIHFITEMDIVIAAGGELYVNYCVKNKMFPDFFGRRYHFTIPPAERRDFLREVQ